MILEGEMKVLVPIDGSAHSDAAVSEVSGRAWPERTEIRVLTVVHSAIPMIPDPAFSLAAAHVDQIHTLREEAPGLLRAAADRIRQHLPSVSVTTTVLDGVPQNVINAEASNWGADLIVLGSHGRGPRTQGLLGSVASTVAADAPCAVEIIRPGRQPVSSIHSRGPDRKS
jgi:nucleotide-binding universal stress UspA family protein